MTYLSDIAASIKSTANSTTDSVGGKTTVVVDSGGSTITVDSTTEFPSTGTIKINDEFITYTGTTTGPDTFTGCTRGAFDTTGTTHSPGDTVTGAWVGTKEQNSKINILATVLSSQGGTLFCQYSDDGGNTWYSEPIQGYKIIANIRSKDVATKGSRYYRTFFLNRSSSQITSLDLSIYYGTFDKLEEESSGVIKTYPVNIPPLSQFKELNTVFRRQIIELKSTYGLSDLRDVQKTDGTYGSITNTIGVSAEYDLDTGATATGYAILESAERARYVPGFSAQVGIGIRIPTAPTSNMEAHWGYFTVDSSTPPAIQNGFLFSNTADGIFVRVYRGGTKIIDVAQADWNTDPLNGSGKSRATLDLTRGNIFQINYAWYGYGIVEWVINVPDPLTTENLNVVIHRYAPTGQTSVIDPNLPISAYVYNGATVGGRFEMFVAGRQYSVLGEYQPNQRITSEARLQLGSIGTTYVPLITARRKTNYLGVSVKIEGIDILSGQNMIMMVRTGIPDSDLTGESFGTPSDTTASETAIEVDIAATAVVSTSGDKLWQGMIGGSSGRQTVLNQKELGFDFIGSDNVCVMIRTVSGSNATVDCVVRYKEEW